MKSYLTTIGEKTTDICKAQLERWGFEVIVLDGLEPWAEKYKRFIDTATEDCIRIDADVIPNRLLKIAVDCQLPRKFLMVQFKAYDFYRNNIGVCSPVYYSAKALEIIRRDFNHLDLRRPEATAWRLPDIEPHTHTSKAVVGMHGFFQKPQDLVRHKFNKVDRKQMGEYDFSLAETLINL